MLDPDFFHKLNRFLADHPASDTRWFSTPARNKMKGGATHSAHLLENGNAIDLVFDSDRELFDGAANAHKYGFTGIELDMTNKHLHLDTKARLWRVVNHGKKLETPLEDWITNGYPNAPVVPNANPTV